MGKRINPAAIGGFIIGAVVLIIVGVLVFSRGQFLSDKRTFVMYFDESVKGLNVGAPVDFQGVRIGSVTDVRVRYNVQDGAFRIPVFIDLVQLDFHPGTPVRLVGDQSDIPELPTLPTALQQASQAAQDVLEKIRQLPLDQLFANVLGITQGLNSLVNAPEIFALVRSLASSSATIQQLVQRMDSHLTRILDDAGGTTTASRALVADLQQLVRTVTARVGPLTDGTG